MTTKYTVRGFEAHPPVNRDSHTNFNIHARRSGNNRSRASIDELYLEADVAEINFFNTARL